LLQLSTTLDIEIVDACDVDLHRRDLLAEELEVLVQHLEGVVSGQKETDGMDGIP